MTSSLTLARKIELYQTTIITMPYREWLANGGAEKPYPPWVVARIAAEMMKPPRVRHSSFASGEAGQCLRRQELKFIGIERIAEHLELEIQDGPDEDPELLNIFNDGKWRHLRWQANLLTGGIIRDIEFPLPWHNMRSMGTVDCVGVVPNDHPNEAWRGKEFGVELKGMNEWPYKRYTDSDEQMTKHKGQFNRYFLSGGFALFVVLYENKNTNGWTEWVFEPDPTTLTDSYQELADLNAAAEARQLHPPLKSCVARMGSAWDNCPFRGKAGICERMEGWPVE